MVKTALAAICAFTLLATAYLTASLLILRPTRANYPQWTLVAAVVLVQGALTLWALRVGSSSASRYVVAAGGAVIAAVGAISLYSTVSGSHFEGYAFVLGSALVIQGLVTIAAFLAGESLKVAGSN